MREPRKFHSKLTKQSDSELGEEEGDVLRRAASILRVLIVLLRALQKRPEFRDGVCKGTEWEGGGEEESGLLYAVRVSSGKQAGAKQRSGVGLTAKARGS